MKNVIFSLLTLFCLQARAQNNVPISSLPVADTLGSPDFYPVVQGGHYKRIDVGIISTQLDSFVNTKVLSGPTGTTGAQGVTGVTGATGLSGPTGATGGGTDSVNNGITNNAGTFQLGGPVIKNTSITRILGTDTVSFISSDTALFDPGPNLAVKGMALIGNQQAVDGILDLSPFGASSSAVLLGFPFQNSQIEIDTANVNLLGKISVNGHLQLRDGTQANNYFLSSDSDGNASWKPFGFDSATADDGFWLTSGNRLYGRNAVLGTIDSSNLFLIVHNGVAGQIFYNSENLSLGKLALVANGISANLTGNSNCAFGTQSLSSLRSGSYNSSYGYQTSMQMTSASANTSLGAGTLINDTSGSGNVAIGNEALSAVVSAGYNTSIGYGTNISFDTINYATAIGAYAIVGESHAIVLGNTTSMVYVGIGTTTPKAMLDIELSSPQSGEVAFKMEDGTQGTSRVLTCDSVGNGHWVTPGITVAQLTALYPSLQQYASDTAAGTGGLTTGQPYVNSVTFALTFKQ